jgi:hypothetical protein
VLYWLLSWRHDDDGRRFNDCSEKEETEEENKKYCEARNEIEGKAEKFLKNREDERNCENE